MGKIHLLVLEFYELWFSYVFFLNDCKKQSILMLCKILWVTMWYTLSQELQWRIALEVIYFLFLHGQNGHTPFFSSKNQLSFPPTAIYLCSLHLLSFKFLFCVLIGSIVTFCVVQTGPFTSSRLIFYTSTGSLLGRNDLPLPPSPILFEFVWESCSDPDMTAPKWACLHIVAAF